MQQNRRGNGWIGWLIFILLVFGSRFLPPVANWLAQVTGLPITTPLLIAALVGLGVVVSVVSSIMSEINKNRPSNESRLPTSPQPMTPSRPVTPLPPSRPSSSTRIPPGLSLPTGEQRLPGPPRFEPIIDPRILIVGLVALAILGAFFLVVLVLSGWLP